MFARIIVRPAGTTTTGCPRSRAIRCGSVREQEPVEHLEQQAFAALLRFLIWRDLASGRSRRLVVNSASKHLARLYHRTVSWSLART
jgi:hypothetical protein